MLTAHRINRSALCSVSSKSPQPGMNASTDVNSSLFCTHLLTFSKVPKWKIPGCVKLFRPTHIQTKKHSSLAHPLQYNKTSNILQCHILATSVCLCLPHYPQQYHARLCLSAVDRAGFPGSSPVVTPFLFHLFQGPWLRIDSINTFCHFLSLNIFHL